MTEHPTTSGNYKTATTLAEKLGVVSIPVVEGTKHPLVPWKRWQTEVPTDAVFRHWFGATRHNIAVITNGLVVYDIDDVAKAELVLSHCGDTPTKSRTPSGGLHFFYRARRGVRVGNRVDIKGVNIDIRAENGLVLIPPSTTDKGAYEWIGRGLHELASLDELPVAKVGWTRERIRRVIRPVEIVEDGDVMVRRARAYIAHIDGAVSGQRGHDRTFRVACVLARKFRLSFLQAWPLLLEWNEQCEPPWTDKELEHKLRDALNMR